MGHSDHGTAYTYTGSEGGGGGGARVVHDRKPKRQVAVLPLLGQLRCVFVRHVQGSPSLLKRI